MAGEVCGIKLCEIVFKNKWFGAFTLIDFERKLYKDFSSVKSMWEGCSGTSLRPWVSENFMVVQRNVEKRTRSINKLLVVYSFLPATYSDTSSTTTVCIFKEIEMVTYIVIHVLLILHDKKMWYLRDKIYFHFALLFLKNDDKSWKPIRSSTV